MHCVWKGVTIGGPHRRIDAESSEVIEIHKVRLYMQLKSLSILEPKMFVLFLLYGCSTMMTKIWNGFCTPISTVLPFCCETTHINVCSVMSYDVHLEISAVQKIFSVSYVEFYIALAEQPLNFQTVGNFETKILQLNIL